MSKTSNFSSEWLLHVDARYNSDIPEPIEADFDVDGQLKLWSTMTMLDLEEIVAYFPRTNSYLVRAKLWSIVKICYPSLSHAGQISACFFAVRLS